ncbi:hypothetical protein Pmani_006647 [Petrolisthes manimaculis]|uniref:Uncharacterized protein n=1 Tax=Petrolisthes manimaculis TaxID=1843537 RepID=A0AAE1QCG3_9EUCA|nr:hypothetical protein Pmani_006647 [Petrolisthes manimaculis]
MQKLWNDIRRYIPKAGRYRPNMSGYIAEFMFKRKYPSHIHRTHEFLRIVAQIYPPQPWTADVEVVPVLSTEEKKTNNLDNEDLDP